MSAPTLVEFLTARLDEDEAAARSAKGQIVEIAGYDEVHEHFERWTADRVLRQVALGRQIVAERVKQSGDGTSGASTALRLCSALAAVYADHPDYDTELYD